MPTTGFVLPNSAAADTLASTTWTSPNNVLADDGVLVSEAITAKNTPATTAPNDTGWLRCSYLGSQFTGIDADATIDQVNIKVEWGTATPASGIGNLDFRWAVSTTLAATVHTNTAEPAVGTVETFDVTAERAWARADFTDGNFTLHLRGRNGNNAGDPGYRFDYAAVEVVWSPPAGTTANADPATVNVAAADASVDVAVPAGSATAGLVAADATVGVGGPEGAPDAILAATNLAGTVSELWDDPTAPDADFLDPVDPAAATDLRVSFPTPTTAPGSGGPTIFQVYLYRTAGAGADPTVIVDLWESGSFVAQLASVAVTSTSGQLVTGTLNPALLSDPSGAGVELRVRGVPG